MTRQDSMLIAGSGSQASGSFSGKAQPSSLESQNSFASVLETNMKTIKYLSTFAAALGLLFAMGCASTPTQSSIGETIDDTVITAKVKAAIIQDDDLSASEINVETFKGVVQLSGFVSERSDIAKATSVTRAIEGVTEVKNDIVTK
jgi:hyperosmotically inducible protein